MEDLMKKHEMTEEDIKLQLSLKQRITSTALVPECSRLLSTLKCWIFRLYTVQMAMDSWNTI